MTELEKLMELIKPHMSGLACEDESGSCELTNCRDCRARQIANDLLASGVIVPPCKVGDTVCNARELAITAIGKQIPIKPIGRHTSYKCPICDRRVRSGKGSSSRGVDYFCQRCGQALDWSDTE